MGINLRRLITSTWFLGLSTLLVFPLLAWLVYLISGDSFLQLFSVTIRELYSIPAFISIGILFGILVIWVAEMPFFDRSLSKYRNLLQGLKLNKLNVFFLAFCAGFGEEVFFRGAIQPYAGIWITAVFFVAIHGYISFRNPAISVFGTGLTLFIALLGWAAEEYSIWHAIAGHFSYDLVLLMYYRKMAGAY